MDFIKKIAKQFFQYEAHLVLKKYKPKIIAISGSVGKTLTKEAAFLVLSKKFFVRKSEKSFTAELGVPLAIIGCPYGSGSPLNWIKNVLIGLKLLVFKSHYPDWLLLEIDADKPGDLESVCSLIKPDILIMTAIGEVPSHIEAFNDMDNFLSEKKIIVNSINREGVIIYNADDKVTSDLVQAVFQDKISCGIESGTDIEGGEFQILYGSGKTGSVPTGMEFDVKHKEDKFNIKVFGSVGIQNEYACILAYALGVYLKVETNDIVASLNKFTSLPGRMNIINGLKDTTILDDSYNSSPVAIKQSLEVLRDIKSIEKKIAVIGDMLELGKYSAEEHKKLAPLLKESATNIICVGLRIHKVIDELLNLGFDESKIISVDTSKEGAKELIDIISEGDIVLVKGSQAMRMEKIVEEVMRHPKDKRKLLVRQEEEWLNRTQ